MRLPETALDKPQRPPHNALTVFNQAVGFTAAATCQLSS